MVKYYIRSNKYSTHERQTKHGRVYDIVFRIVTIDGEEKQKRISGFKTKADAKAGYLEFVEKFCELTRYVPKKPKELTAQFNPTVAELVPTYIAALGNQNKGSSIYDKHNNLTHYIIPQLGDVRIKDLTKERLYQWQDELWSMKNPRTGDFYSHQYLSKLRNILSAFLSWVSDRYGFVNHLPNVKKPKRRTPKTEMLFWTREEFDTFIAVVDNPTYRAMYCMLFFTGRRKGEVLALSPADITEKGIRFNKTYTRKTIDGQPYNITSTKNESVGFTPICAPLKHILAQYEPQAPFYFGGTAPIHENTLSHAFDRYIALAGVKRIRMHDLRHSFVSMCIHLGASVYVVADLIGDTVEQVLKTYGHLYQEDRQSIIDRIQ